MPGRGGRPKGLPKTGGRKKGVKNKIQTARIEALSQKGEMPLDYMLRVLRDPETESARRDDMAKAAAPYTHARLSAMTVGGDANNPIRTESVIRDERVPVKERVERLFIEAPADAPDRPPVVH